MRMMKISRIMSGTEIPVGQCITIASLLCKHALDPASREASNETLQAHSRSLNLKCEPCSRMKSSHPVSSFTNQPQASSKSSLMCTPVYASHNNSKLCPNTMPCSQCKR
jgi:hypothetical protein